MNFRKSTFTKKFRIDIYRTGAFRNFLKMYVNPHYLEKVSKIEKSISSFMLLGPQPNICLLCVRLAVIKKMSGGEGGVFLFAEGIPSSRGYYMILDMPSVQMI